MFHVEGCGDGFTVDPSDRISGRSPSVACGKCEELHWPCAFQGCWATAQLSATALIHTHTRTQAHKDKRGLHARGGGGGGCTLKASEKAICVAMVTIEGLPSSGPANWFGFVIEKRKRGSKGGAVRCFHRRAGLTRADGAPVRCGCQVPLQHTCAAASRALQQEQMET